MPQGMLQTDRSHPTLYPRLGLPPAWVTADKNSTY